MGGGGGHAGTPASVFITLHRLRVMRPMMLISVMVSAPYSSLSAAKRLSLESPEDTHRTRQTANYRGRGEPPEALHSAHTQTGKHPNTLRFSHTNKCCTHTSVLMYTQTNRATHVCAYSTYRVHMHSHTHALTHTHTFS